MTIRRRTKHEMIVAKQEALNDRDACEVAADRTIYDAFVDGAEGQRERGSPFDYWATYDDIEAIDARIDSEEPRVSVVCEDETEKAARMARMARAKQEFRLARAEYNTRRAARRGETTK